LLRQAGTDSLQCPLLAESGHQDQHFSSESNDRFGEKRTLSLRLPKLNRKTSALPSEADIKLILSKEAANDPKRNSKLLGHLFYGMSLVYANGAKQQIAVTGEK